MRDALHELQVHMEEEGYLFGGQHGLPPVSRQTDVLVFTKSLLYTISQGTQHVLSPK
jgi:hypothetical protein